MAINPEAIDKVVTSFVVGNILLFFGYFWKVMWDTRKSRKTENGRRL